jgi:hypothetical protein
MIPQTPTPENDTTFCGRSIDSAAQILAMSTGNPKIGLDRIGSYTDENFIGNIERKIAKRLNLGGVDLGHLTVGTYPKTGFWNRF